MLFGTRLSVEFAVNLGATLSVNQDSRLAGKTTIGAEQGLSDTQAGTVIANKLSVAQDATFGAALSVRQMTKLGSCLSVFGDGYFGAGLSVRQFVQFGQRLR